MIVPSIDLQDGEAVQLIEGAEHELSAGDPRPIIERFRIAGEVAVIDLDAAMGEGDNTAIIEELVGRGRCRVGGGIRSVETARHWLDAGAHRIILGTAAEPDLLEQLPRERVIAALDAREGEVVVEGWQTPTGESIEDRMERLRPYVGGFLVTFVEREGHQDGTDLEHASALATAAGDRDLTVAGGITTPAEVARLDEMGIDAQVGMALYRDTLHLGDAIAAPLSSDREDGLWPTVIADERGVALGLAYSDVESVRAAIEEQRGIYHSRSRGLWRKGDTSGATQTLLELVPDCDRDTLRARVRQRPPGFCHEETRTCWGDWFDIGTLESILEDRNRERPSGSYTTSLLEDDEAIAAKLREETDELIEATDRPHIRHEAADVLYFLLVKLTAEGLSMREVEAELARRHDDRS